MHKVLVVEDDKAVVEGIKEFLSKQEWVIYIADSVESAVKLINKEKQFDAVILDLMLDTTTDPEIKAKCEALIGDEKLTGIAVLEYVSKNYPDICVVIETVVDKLKDAIKCMQLGAYDYITKPFDPTELKRAVEKGIEYYRLKAENKRLEEEKREIESEKIDLSKENIALRKELEDKYKIIGKSKKIQEVLNLIEKISKSDSTVLIQGETGTGKELVAKLIYMKSKRFGKPFKDIHCSSFSEELIESELFGHEKGAYTDAKEFKKGWFEVTNGGTILLDDIHNLSLKAQTKLLRVLQEKTFSRVGGTDIIKTDVRIIATTNKNLEVEIEKGLFLQDLFFRFKVVPICVPSLRERKEDIPLLIEHFLEKHKIDNKKKFSEYAMEMLMKHDYPGNVRELENIIERAVILCEADTIEPHDLCLITEEKSQIDEFVALTALKFSDAKEKFEKEYILGLLKETEGNISQAAEKAGLDRNNFKDKMKKYGIKAKNPSETNNSNKSNADKRHLINLLKIHKANLLRLEEKKAKCGPLDVPNKIQNQIEDEKKEIKRIEKEIERIEE